MLCLFDVMGSTSDDKTRALYADGFEQVLAPCVGGAYLCADIITNNTLANATLPVRVEFPTHSLMGMGELDYQEACKQRSEEARSEVAKLIAAKPERSGTDIMNACLFAAKRFFSGGTPAQSQRKVLVLFSDMIEQSARHNFTSAELSDEGIDRIIEAERTAGTLPALAGVAVWVAGATSEAEGGLPPARIQRIEAFWRAYFAAAGASMPENQYGTVLFDFHLR